MSMSLTADQLRELANQLDKLNEIAITVETFICQGHKVMVQPLDGQLTVVGITSGGWSGPAAVSTCRCRPGTACRCAMIPVTRETVAKGSATLGSTPGPLTGGPR